MRVKEDGKFGLYFCRFVGVEGVPTYGNLSYELERL